MNKNSICIKGAASFRRYSSVFLTPPPDRKRGKVRLFKRSKVAGREDPPCWLRLPHSQSVSLCEETGVSFNRVAQFHHQVRGQKSSWMLITWINDEQFSAALFASCFVLQVKRFIIQNDICRFDSIAQSTDTMTTECSDNVLFGFYINNKCWCEVFDSIIMLGKSKRIHLLKVQWLFTDSTPDSPNTTTCSIVNGYKYI